MAKSDGFVLFITGLPSAGKTTLARAVCEELARHSIPHEHIDGDEVRALVGNDSFAPAARDRHVRTVAWTARLLERNGIATVISLIAPQRSSRLAARELCKHFIEVYLSTPVEVCEKRDARGMYQKARSGKLTDFTGVSASYEAPDRAEIVLDGSKLSPKESVERVLAYLCERNLISG
jgi:adenylyl-sulfate kinase